MAVSKYTLANALAFLAISGGKRNLHIDTRIAMHGYTELQEYKMSFGDDQEPLTLHREVLNAEGWALAKTSRLWKAHEQLLGLGFEVEKERSHKPYFITYRRYLDDQDRVITAFTGAKGTVYAQDPDATEKRWETNLIATHKNG
jgi:hypothetical protein